MPMQPAVSGMAGRAAAAVAAAAAAAERGGGQCLSCSPAEQVLHLMSEASVALCKPWRQLITI